MNHVYFGIDIGGTKTEVSLISIEHPLGHLDSGSASFHAHKVLVRRRIPTERNHGHRGFLSNLKSLIQASLTEVGIPLSSIRGMGVGIPGSVHPELQQMVQGSIPFFKDLDLRAEFGSALGFSGTMVFENDANCFALAESRFGAGADWARSHHVSESGLCLLGITLGTGVGGGIIMNGELIRGRRGGTGEIGHISLKAADRSCYCGKSGCAEQFLSGPGLEHAYSLRARPGQRVSGKQIFELARSGDPFAVSTTESYRDDLLQFLSNLANLLDPHVIVLGGGISLEDQIYQGLENRLSESCFLTSDPPSVLKNSLGDAAGALGAAYLAFSENQGEKAPS